MNKTAKEKDKKEKPQENVIRIDTLCYPKVDSL